MKSFFSLLFRSIFIISLIVLFSFQDPYSIKRISDKNFRYEFYTSSKKINPNPNKTYYWFKGGVIHEAEFGIAGEILNGNFKKYFHSNQLAEQGVFKNGLKISLWKTWYENGKIETTQVWKSGLKNGPYIKCNNLGEVIEKGYFKKNLKHGLWIDFAKKDSTIYKNGYIFLKKKKLTKVEKEKIKTEKKANKEKIKIKNTENPKNQEKSSWFSKLFKKKKKND